MSKKFDANRKADSIADAFASVTNLALEAELKWLTEELRNDPSTFWTLSGFMRSGTLAPLLKGELVTSGASSDASGGDANRKKIRPTATKFKHLKTNNTLLMSILGRLEAKFLGMEPAQIEPDVFTLLTYCLGVSDDAVLPSQYLVDCAYVDKFVNACVARYRNMGSKLADVTLAMLKDGSYHGYYTTDDKSVKCTVGEGAVLSFAFAQSIEIDDEFNPEATATIVINDSAPTMTVDLKSQFEMHGVFCCGAWGRMRVACNHLTGLGVEVKTFPTGFEFEVKNLAEAGHTTSNCIAEFA